MKTELTNYDIERLDRGDCQEVLFRGVVGSRAYGTANENSDTDIRGIFAVPSSAYIRLQSPPKQVSDERNDRTYYSLLRFCELLSSGNPTGIEMLYLPGDCVLKSTPAYSRLLADRNMFITRKVVDSHFYYALSQMKKARGANKRVWNPWPEEPPSVEEYCLFLDNAKGLAVPVVRFDGGRLDMLLSIRRGEWSFKDIMALAEEKKSVIESGRERLPPDCDLKKVDLLIADIMREIDR